MNQYMQYDQYTSRFSILKINLNSIIEQTKIMMCGWWNKTNNQNYEHDWMITTT